MLYFNLNIMSTRNVQAIQLPPQFNSINFEEKIYAQWKERGSFAPRSGKGPPFVIVLPPPNVTGVLHLGHGLNISLQDILVRYYRMRGRETLWVPGTDHAGIATQTVVEKLLQKEGISREKLGREKFVQKTWELVKNHHQIITQQLERIGSSCDWSRERFTLDEGLSQAVTDVFVKLYERNLIYRGTYMVNWSCASQTALSDDEVEHKEVKGTLYYIRYPLRNSDHAIEIATTRPETLFGDMAVAVHPEDPRYTSLIGSEVLLPLCDRYIPVIADPTVDRDFGTGALKITPAHAPVDHDIALQHDLEIRNIIQPDGRLNDAVPEPYQGAHIQHIRNTVVKDLEHKDFLIQQEPHVHQVGFCYRTGDLVEPYLSEQWFVRMKPMAEKALQVVKEKKIRFYPERWENTYAHWMNNIRDWCISRQLWWGHRIPAWYDEEGNVIVSRVDPASLPEHQGKQLRQDPDVLDTWFSSWLWPFSVFGWPETTDDLQRYFPTSCLVTGYDIIFFWVARMVMAGMEFHQQAPFTDIYITSLIRDKKGRKMSKSLGNGIDPLDVVEKYGADAMRFTLSYQAALGTDISLDMNSFSFGSRFANKLWNASRYILGNIENRNLLAQPVLTDVDRWIYHRLHRTITAIHTAMESYLFSEATQQAYHFFWNDFCDWYLECSKQYLYGDDEQERDRSISLLLYLLEEILRFLHPFLPFTTEELYSYLPDFPPLDGTPRTSQLITADYPFAQATRECPELADNFAELQTLIRTIRTMRSEFTIPSSQRIHIRIVPDPDWGSLPLIRSQQELIHMLTGAQSLTLDASAEVKEKESPITVASTGFTAHLYIRHLIDTGAEKKRLEKTIEKLQQKKDQAGKKLENPQFLSRAKEKIVQGEREKYREAEELIQKNLQLLHALT